MRPSRGATDLGSEFHSVGFTLRHMFTLQLAIIFASNRVCIGRVQELLSIGGLSKVGANIYKHLFLRFYKEGRPALGGSQAENWMGTP